MNSASSLPALWLVVGGVYLVVGAAVALRLAQRGATRTVAVSALGFWPLLLPLLPAPSGGPRPGPLASRIRQCAADLRATMADPAANDIVVVEDLDDLVRDLQRADERLGMVDALLTDVGRTASRATGLEALQRARQRAASEVEAVLDGMVELRLSIGLRSLAGNAVPVQERLVDLRARLGALDEIAAFELATHP